MGCPGKWDWHVSIYEWERKTSCLLFFQNAGGGMTSWTFLMINLFINSLLKMIWFILHPTMSRGFTHRSNFIWNGGPRMIVFNNTFEKWPSSVTNTVKLRCWRHLISSWPLLTSGINSWSVSWTETHVHLRMVKSILPMNSKTLPEKLPLYLRTWPKSMWPNGMLLY